MRSLIRLGILKTIFTNLGLISGQAVSLDTGNEENVTMVHTYGFNSAPPTNARCVMLAPFGYTENVFAIPFNPNAPRINAGETVIYNYIKNAVATKIYLKENGEIDIIPNGVKVNILKDLSVSGDVNTDGVYKVANTKVVGVQQPAIPDAVGGTVIDVQARLALNALLVELRNHGLIAT